jgi:opacity protein-like surface antigen
MRILPSRFLASLVLAAMAVVLVPPPAIAQTDVALSGYGAFTGTSSGGGDVQQSPSNEAGGIVEARHIANSILGFEGTYSFNRANQTYASGSLACPGIPVCYYSSEPVSVNAHEITGDWVPSMHFANLRPFAVLGGGLLLDVPATSQAKLTTVTTGCLTCAASAQPTTITTSLSPTRTATTGVFVYGAGLDWGVLPHIGLRFQYRGNLYTAPNVSKLFTSTNAFIHTAEPMIGAYFKF